MHQSAALAGPPLIPLAENLRRHAAVKRCPSRICRIDLGCGMATCALGKGRTGLVSLNDCLACVAECGLPLQVD